MGEFTCNAWDAVITIPPNILASHSVKLAAPIVHGLLKELDALLGSNVLGLQLLDRHLSCLEMLGIHIANVLSKGEQASHSSTQSNGLLACLELIVKLDGRVACSVLNNYLLEGGDVDFNSHLMSTFVRAYSDRVLSDLLASPSKLKVRKWGTDARLLLRCPFSHSFITQQNSSVFQNCFICS